MNTNSPLLPEERRALHIDRCTSAGPLRSGLDALDGACGTGYGTAILKSFAKSAMGIDCPDDSKEPSAAAKWMLPVNLINAARGLKMARAPRLGQVVDVGPRERHQLRLPGHWQCKVVFDHRLAFNKTSFSSTNCLILACLCFTLGPALVLRLLAPFMEMSAAHSRNCVFHWALYWAWTSKSSASSANVLSPLQAAKATFAFYAAP